MKISLCAMTLAGVVLSAGTAGATTYYVASTGSDGTNTGTMASPWRTVRHAASVTQPGDTVYIRGGNYTEGVSSIPRSGTSAAWITFSAYPGELPIFDGGGGGGTGFSSTTAQFIRVVGIVERNWSSSGFGNGWVNDTGTSNGNWQFINCIADGNGINGITFYNATGILIDQSIIVHNGNLLPSWSSGVNLFHVMGDATTNIVRRSVSFENIDISTNHSDGSGFILDQSSSGALFENNIGFRNGGSCIRINTPGAVIVNNTCYHDGLYSADTTPPNPGEVYFSGGPQGAIMINNLLAASGWNNTQNAVFNGPTGTSSVSNLTVNMNGATPFFTNAAGIDFTLVAGSTTVIDKGSTMRVPATDIGFDPKCIKALSGQAQSFWQYAPDYDYITNVARGVAGCFHPATRPVGAPDIGAYELGGTPIPGTGGAGGGGAGGAGGTTGAAGGGGGVTGAGGTGTGGASPAGAAGAGGAGVDAGGGTLTDGGSGCACAVSAGTPGAGLLGLFALAALALRSARRSRRRRGFPRR